MKELQQTVKEASMVLVGIGLEFEQSTKDLCRDSFLEALSEKSAGQPDEQLIRQYMQYYCLSRNPDSKIVQAYDFLEEILRDKNYFIVSLSTDDLIFSSKLKRENIVAPCGGYRAFQCECRAGEDSLLEDRKGLEDFLCSMENAGGDWRKVRFPSCSICGKPLWFNQISTPGYQEVGYLKQWERYTLWLQGTLHKELCILELGVGMEYPQVIRFPFEKVAFFNRKAHFFRIHSKLYHLTEELKERGVSIPRNPVDFLWEMSHRNEENYDSDY